MILILPVSKLTPYIFLYTDSFNKSLIITALKLINKYLSRRSWESDWNISHHVLHFINIEYLTVILFRSRTLVKFWKHILFPSVLYHAVENPKNASVRYINVYVYGRDALILKRGRRISVLTGRCQINFISQLVFRHVSTRVSWRTQRIPSCRWA